MDIFQEKWLAVDYGEVRVGTALSYGSLAEPLEIIPHNENLVKRIQELCAKNQVFGIVLGVSENEMAKKTLQFGKVLEEVIKLPIRYQDETLSSADTHRKFSEAYAAGLKPHAGPIDHFAAAHILQDFLDDNMENSS